MLRAPTASTSPSSSDGEGRCAARRTAPTALHPGGTPVVETTAICRFCHATCGLKVTIEQGRVVDIIGDIDNPVYHGYSCVKGRNFHEFHYDPNRVLHPLRRDAAGLLQPVGLDAALTGIADELQANSRATRPALGCDVRRHLQSFLLRGRHAARRLHGRDRLADALQQRHHRPAGQADLDGAAWTMGRGTAGLRRCRRLPARGCQPAGVDVGRHPDVQSGEATARGACPRAPADRHRPARDGDGPQGGHSPAVPAGSRRRTPGGDAQRHFCRGPARQRFRRGGDAGIRSAAIRRRTVHPGARRNAGRRAGDADCRGRANVRQGTARQRHERHRAEHGAVRRADGLPRAGAQHGVRALDSCGRADAQSWRAVPPVLG